MLMFTRLLSDKRVAYGMSNAEIAYQPPVKDNRINIFVIRINNKRGYAKADINGNIDFSLPRQEECFWSPTVFNQKCYRSLSEGLLRDFFPKFFTEDFYLTVSIDKLTMGSYVKEGMLKIRYAIFSKDTSEHLGDIYVTIGLHDCMVYEISSDIRSPEVTVNTCEVDKIARHHLSTSTGICEKNFQLISSLQVAEPQKKGKAFLSYCLRDEMQSHEDVNVYTIVLDNELGKVVHYYVSKFKQQQVKEYKGNYDDAIAELYNNKQGIADRWPTWSAKGDRIYFVSNRPHPGSPWWRRLHALSAVELHSGTISYIIPGWINRFVYKNTNYYQLAPDNAHILYNSDVGNIYASRLSDGQLWKIQYPINTIHEAKPCAVFQHKVGNKFVLALCYAQQDNSLFAKILIGNSETPFVSPVVSCDQSHVYFAKRINDNKYSLYSVDTLQGSDSIKYIYSADGQIHRISVFPDGEHLLISSDTSLSKIHILTGEQQELWSNVTNDMKKYEADVSHDGHYIVYSTLNNSKQQLLYSSRLDGTEEQQITYDNENEMMPYEYNNGNNSYGLSISIYEQQLK
jgi:hypothetical protein